VPVDQIAWMLEEYRTCYMGWNVKHFHEHLQKRHGFRWGYTWTKTYLQGRGLLARAPRRGAHRRKRPRRPMLGMLLHQSLLPRRRETARGMLGCRAGRRSIWWSPWTMRRA
jgi:hypothetical protein